MSTFEVVEATAEDAAELAAVSRAVTRVDPTDRPEVPPITVDEIAALNFCVPVDRPARTWLARDASSGDPIGWVLVRLPTASNRTHVDVRVEVVPERRHQGVGAALLAHALGAIDRDRTIVAANPDAAALPWCEHLGLPSRLVVRESRLDLAELDLDVLRSWLEPADAVAAGYRMVTWRGAPTDELLAAVCIALESMADAPVDDMEFEHPALTPDFVRGNIAVAAVRFDQFAALVLAPDGSPAGFTELGVNRFRPILVDQGDTVVVAGHRGHRLGRWLKAANLLAMLDARPEARFVNTFNAESNPWMLSINEAMAFRPFREVHTVQGPTVAVLDAIGRRTRS